VEDGSIRASDADRDQAVATLREHLVAGRLTLEEFTDRVGVALSARETGQLTRIQADLPHAPAGGNRKAARFSSALLGHVARRGRMRVRGWCAAISVFGDLDFDLREAVIEGTQIGVTVLAFVGNVDIYVPEGISVDVGGIAIMGHRRDWGQDADRVDAPVLRVRVIGFGGTVDIWRVPAELRGSSYTDVIRALRLKSLPQPPPG